MESVVESVKIPLEFADKSIIIVFIGIICWTGLKNIFTVKTFKFFALGNRNFSTGELVATIVATYLSGSGFSLRLSEIYNKGFHYMLITVSPYIALIILAFFIVPRMQDFLGNISMAEAISKTYGQITRYIISIVTIIGSVGAIAVQFKVFGKIFEYFTGNSSTFSLVFAASLVTLYSAVGGIKSVVYTDIIQFLTLSISIIIIGLIMFQFAGGSTSYFSKLLQYPKFNLSEIFTIENTSFWNMVNLMLFFFIRALLSPPTAHRILMASNLTKIRSAIFISAIALTIIVCLIAIIPTSLFIINPELDPKELIPEIVNKYSIFAGIAGILIIGVLAMSMSTADSHINTSAVTFANDVWPSKNPAHQLYAAKSFSFLLGLLALGLASLENNLLKIILFTKGFYVAMVIPVLLLTIFGFRTGKNVILISMGTGFSAIVLGKLFLSIEPSVIAAAVTTLMILVLHYSRGKEGGFIIRAKADSYLIFLRKERKNNFKELRSFLFDVMSGEYFQANLERYEIRFTVFGFFSILSTLAIIYGHRINLNSSLQTSIYIMMIAISVASLLSTMLPYRDDFLDSKITLVLWYVSIFLMLGVFNTFFVMITKHSLISFGIFTANIFIMAYLVGWKMTILMNIVGYWVAKFLYQIYAVMHEVADENISARFVYAYLLAMLASSVMMLFKPKEEALDITSDYLHKKEEDNRQLNQDNSELYEVNTELEGELEFYNDQQKKLELLLVDYKLNTKKMTKMQMIKKLQDIVAKIILDNNPDEEPKDLGEVLYPDDPTKGYRQYKENMKLHTDNPTKEYKEYKKNLNTIESIARSLFRNDFTVEEIASVVRLTIEEVELILKDLIEKK
ncbi:sodium:solute symporter family protein [Rickettsia endosymbiont of Cardiosporidium cionae]|uniref:sodium:solute symporter family protein n=1 Tax=Rickettsia endosymbiont of Cardiosporidium cionae TaxID=2777155 RepID=UPI0018943CBA|nr:sodium:solute symporter family protein [Rickettsia endosymbiont of Cardiosporidium cionae]KAF8818511.1 Na+/proline symporter [Rickettsia endosymbiont of Cardiosporidium cionae]